MLRVWTRARHKNSRLLFHARNWARLATPGPLYRWGLESLLAEPWSSADRREIQRRVDHAYRVGDAFAPGPEARVPGLDLLTRRRNYAFDLLRYARRASPGVRLDFRFGDETNDPGRPTLVKARTIDEPSGHSIVFPLNQVRHFVFVRDPLPFEAKRDLLVWRGAAVRPWRREFLARYFGRPGLDLGCTDRRPEHAAWQRPFLGIGEQLRYRFILSIEGIDVATNLKWILSSNSVCVMAPPTKESWFCESWLVPGEHYIPVRPDHADLEEQLARYRREPAAAQRIIRAAQAHVARFRHPQREELIALLVLLRYIHDSGQGPLSDRAAGWLADFGWAAPARPSMAAATAGGRRLSVT